MFSAQAWITLDTYKSSLRFDNTSKFLQTCMSVFVQNMNVCIEMSLRISCSAVNTISVPRTIVDVGFNCGYDVLAALHADLCL